MIYEMRIYYAVPGQLNKLNDRFANHTMGFFTQHGIGMVGFWTDLIGISNRLTYILSYDSMGDREAKWGAFQADKGWQEVRAETEKDGALVASVENSFLQLTPYSPQPRVTTALQELRTYHTIPGKLPALHHPVRQSHRRNVREARHRKRRLLDRRRWHQQPIGLHDRLPQHGT